MAGLVFLYSDHPLEQFLSNICSVPYSQIGFIFKETIRGEIEFKVYLIDLLRVYGQNIVSIMKVSDLINEPLLNKISIRWFNLPPEEEGEIRIAIASLLSKIKRPPLEVLIKQLVGMDKSGLLGIDVVCQVLMRVGINLPMYTDEMSSEIKYPTRVQDVNLIGAAKFLGLMGRPFSRQDPRFKNLERIGELEEVHLSTVDPILKSKRLSSELEKSTLLFTEASVIFFRLFSSDRSFMTSTLNKSNESQKSISPEKDLLTESLELNREMLGHIPDVEERKILRKKYEKLIGML